jgi:Tol biopolymer transport system component
MNLAPGTRFGLYEILAPIGAGGMGEVYRARDTKLKRDVALKVLPEAFVGDPSRMTRFQREAELLASLNHPNIAHIYGVEDCALAMELVEGSTLPCPFPIDTSLAYAKQIAEALEYAHERGVIHRDLKPANIKVTPEGMVKLLDFGLAKAIEEPGSTGDDPGNSPTLTLGATRVGVILGTAAYMSPEQASGKAADRRADIWSFGAVLYEMLSGKQAFAGESVSDTLASVLKLEPDWSTLPADTPESIRRLIRRCLTKDRKQRLQAIGEARICIDEWLANPVGATEVPRETKARHKFWAVAAATLILGLLGVWAFAHFRHPAADERVYRFEINPPEGAQFVFGFNGGGISLSPDGRTAAYVTTSNGRTSLWIRPLDGTTAREVAGTEGAGFPFWSPDSKSIGFFVGSKLQRVEMSGSTPQTICNQCPGRGGAWSTNGQILFGTLGAGLFQIAASGGTAAPFTTLDAADGETAHIWPQILPEGKFLYYAGGTTEKPETSGIFAASLAKPGERVKLLSTLNNALYAPGPDGEGYLIWRRGDMVVGQEFDPSTLKLSGDARPLATTVSSWLGQVSVAVSGRGQMVYYPFNTLTQFTWLDRMGKAIGPVSEPSTTRGFRVSPDGRRFVASLVADHTSLWLIDVERGLATRFTTDNAIAPVWSPDGRTIIYTSGAPYYLFRKQASGAESAQRVTQTPYQFIEDWSRDGRYLLGHEGSIGSRQTLWIRPASPDDGKPKPYIDTTFNTNMGRFSPDSHWIAFASDESGRPEVYIDAVPEPRGKVRISTHGGTYPAWGSSGRELFYVGADYKLMSVALKINGDSVEPSAPHELFQLPALDPGVNPYDVAPDGRFLVPAPPQRSRAQPLIVIVNWPALLKEGAAK